MSEKYAPMDGDVFEHFREGLRTGEFVPMPDAQVERIIDENYLGFEPLVPLTSGEGAELRERLIRHVGGYINGMHTKQNLCRQDHQVVSYTSAGRYIRGYDGHQAGDKWEKSKVKIVFPEDLEYELGQIRRHGKPKDGVIDVRPWTQEEKLAKISDPKTWNWNYSGSSQRHLNDYMGDDCFRWMIAQSRKGLHWDDEGKTQRAPRQRARVLEIGCGGGIALTDMKEIDPTIETHGINLAPEFSMFPGHQYHFMTLERMPKDFEEQFDYIHSHQCFRYAGYPDAGYANVLKSLSVGGICWLHLLPNDKNPLDKGGCENGKKRDENIRQMYGRLYRDGFIRPISQKRPTLEEVIKLRSIPEDYDMRQKDE